MFSFIHERKALESLERVSDGAAERIASNTPVRRAAALAVANATLIVSARKWGRNVTHAPMKLSPEVAAEAVSAFSDRLDRLSLNAESLQGRPSGDPAVDSFRWDLMATEVLVLTLGASLSANAAREAGKCWKHLWSARRSAEDAAQLMMHFSKAYSTPPIPLSSPGEKVTLKRLVTLASVLPPMYRPKKKAKRPGS
jgi:hypothetical protein